MVLYTQMKQTGTGGTIEYMYYTVNTNQRIIQ